MQIMKILSIAAAIGLITACFFPWVEIENKHIIVTGFNAAAIDFGKPGLFHVLFAGIFILFLLLHKIWSLRTAFFISAFNIAWAIRNFVAISACSGGECPVKFASLYIVLISSALMLVLALFVEKKIEEQL